MNRKLIGVLLGALATAALAMGGIAVAGGEDAVEGPDTPITGDALEQASAAALAHTGEGEVTETEVGDEESYYEVEVTLPDGREVDVQLDESFTVVGEEVEDEADDD
ncbi:PepSY domain-containing protein [Euzebya rosea]|uniref:PepSY domain-containing protein n=1 Tax=Euzebya rosea TaxID=2052804 RepID=UPI000D3E83AF|nr:PepSY domain-containing protein [Euzebya rosea]